jgi:hypothetical protein
MRLLIVAYAVGLMLGSLSVIEWVVVRLVRWWLASPKRARIAR